LLKFKVRLDDYVEKMFNEMGMKLSMEYDPNKNAIYVVVS